MARRDPLPGACLAALCLAITAVTPGPASSQDACVSTDDPQGEVWRRLQARRSALDSLHTELVALTGGTEDARPSGVLVAYADTASGSTQVIVDIGSVPQDVKNRLTRRFLDYLRAHPLEPDEGPASIDLRRGVETDVPRGDGVVVRCPPTLANRQEVVDELAEAGARIVEFMETAGDRARAPRRELVLDVIVDAEGETRKVMLATPSGNPYLNAQAREVGRVFEWEPATLNGVPVATWIRLPVNFNLPEPD